jgi:hypothetical protein
VSLPATRSRRYGALTGKATGPGHVSLRGSARLGLDDDTRRPVDSTTNASIPPAVRPAAGLITVPVVPLSGGSW